MDRNGRKKNGMKHKVLQSECGVPAVHILLQIRFWISI